MGFMSYARKYGFYQALIRAPGRFCGALRTKLQVFFYRLRGIKFGDDVILVGKLYISSNSNKIIVGNNVSIGRFSSLNTSDKGEIIIGDRTSLNDFTVVSAEKRIEIGKDVVAGQFLVVVDSDHKFTGKSRGIMYQGLISKPVVIEDNAWIGAHVCILKGVKVGKGNVIGANSVVTKDVPPYSIVVGSPAKVIKKIK